MIKAIIFDMDDTLYPEEQYVKSGFKSVDAFLQSIGINNFYEKALTLFEVGSRGNIFNKALEDLNIDYDDDFIIKLLDIYRKHSPEIQLYEDAQAILKDLINKYPLGLITDGYKEVQRNKVEALNLNNYFDKIVITDELGRENWKPSTLPYELMREQLKVEHTEMVYIGDNVSKDFLAANKLGWITIHIKRLNGQYNTYNVPDEYKAKYEIQSLMEINDILNLGCAKND